MKTTFGPGFLVQSKLLNALQQISFDGRDEDFHYPPLSINDIQRGGFSGLDTAYVTLDTDQLVTGSKSFVGLVSFGDPVSSVAARSLFSAEGA